MRSAILNPRLAPTGRLSLAHLLSPKAIGLFLLKLWQSNHERRRLADLDHRLLRDMGIDPMAAAHEIDRPFWQLAAHHETELRRQLGF
jgi:uncharacterized protein YjiS (DUF1127 family)